MKYAIHSICRLIFQIIILSLPLSVYSSQITDDQIKTGFINNFLKYVTWENESFIDTFKIAVYGNDQGLIAVLKNLENVQVKNKPIHILAIKSLSDKDNVQVLFIPYDYSYQVKEILNAIKNKNTLLITDRCEYQRYIMINFTYNENSKIQFEINTKNIEEAHLRTSPKLVLIGGNEIDVRKLYLETEKSLFTEKEKTENYEKELNQKKIDIHNIILKLSQLNNDIETLNLKISTQKNDLANLTSQNKEQKRKLDITSIKLDKQKSEINIRESRLIESNKELYSKQQKIETYIKVLNSLKSEIETRQITIHDQEKILNNQVAKIKTQQNFLYLLVALVILAFALVFVIYRNYRINQQKNLELEKLSIVARETDNAVIIAKANGEFEWVNEGFTRIFGYTLEQFMENKGNNLFTASSYKLINEVLNSISTEKRSVNYESLNQNIKGENMWLHSTITPILDENRNIKKLIIIDSDITPLKEAELKIIEKNEEIQRQSEELFEQTEQLTILNHELETKKNNLEETLEKLKSTQTQLVESEKMIILGQLTAGIAHEINNPINYINSGIDGISMAIEQIIALLGKYEVINADNVKKQLNIITEYKKEISYTNLLPDINQLTKDVKSGIYKTIEIIKGLRTFSRLDESDLKLIDLHKSINSTLVILRNKFIGRIEIIKEFGIIPEVECYPGKINQVLLNILVNAIQSIQDKGQIIIKTKLKEKNKIECVEIRIKDTGSGMTDEIKKKIFEPFFTTKEIGEGTGLGLSITHSIIESHHGFISVDSTPGIGTEFTIILPVNYSKKEKTVTNNEIT